LQAHIFAGAVDDNSVLTKLLQMLLLPDSIVAGLLLTKLLQVLLQQRLT
jgi:hypothetical protein